MDLTLQQKLQEVRASGSIPKLLTINLALAITDQHYRISGDFFKVWEAPSHLESVTVKFNNNNEPGFTFRRGKKLQTPFDEVYITTPAGQAGNLEIIYGDSSSGAMLDAWTEEDSASEVTEDILNQLEGDVLPDDYGRHIAGVAQTQVFAANADRKSFHLFSDLANLGIIYIGYDATVSATNYVHAIAAGGSYWREDYRGPIHVIATLAAQNVQYDEL